jgi:hypothetical protein
MFHATTKLVKLDQFSGFHSGAAENSILPGYNNAASYPTKWNPRLNSGFK